MAKGIKIVPFTMNKQPCCYCGKNRDNTIMYETEIENDKRDLTFLYLCKDCMTGLSQMFQEQVTKNPAYGVWYNKDFSKE